MDPLCAACTPVLQEAARRVFWLNLENENLRKKNDELTAGSAKIVDAFEATFALILQLKSRGILSVEEAGNLATAVAPCVALSENLAAGVEELSKRGWGKKAKFNS